MTAPENTFGGGDWGVDAPTAPGRPFSTDVPYRPFENDSWWGGLANNAAQYWYNNVARPLGYDNKPNLANEDGSINWGAFWNDVAKTNYELLQPSNWGTAAGLSVNGAIGIYDSGIRVVNTVVGGVMSVGWGLSTAAAGGFDWSKSSNSLMRDGSLSWDDINQMFDPFENETTIGQQAVLGMATFTQNAGDTALGWVAPDFASNVIASRQRYIAQNTEERLTDPQNQRGLGSMWMLFDQNYDIWDEWQRESAFEQMGPWQITSGALDAAWQFWAAPEVIAAKALGVGAKSARFIDMSQQGARANMARELMDYRIYQMTDGQYGARTTWGLMAERLSGMDEAAIRKAGIARNSNDPEYVSFVLGRAHNPTETGDALLALAGDRNAAARVAMRSPLAGDVLLQRFASGDELRRVLDETVDEFVTDPLVKPANANDVILAMSGDADAMRRVASASTDLDDPRIPPTLRAAAKQRRQQTASERLLGTDAEISQVQAVVDEWLAMSGGVTLRDVPRNLGNLSRAQRKASRASGQAWQSTTFSMGPGGRIIRFLRSAANKPGTKRWTGSFSMSDNAEFAAELESTLTTPKWIRRKAAYAEGDPRRMITVFRDVETEAGRTVRQPVQMDVADYRRAKMNEGLSLAADGTTSLATKRLNFVQSLENDLFFTVLNDYGVNVNTAADLLENFKYLRNKVKDQLVERGWVRDADGSVDAISAELQSELAESVQFIDLDFVDMVIRTSEYGLAARTGRAVRYSGIQLLGYFDMFWRPLALLRLGYTQRNLAESSLRSLAAFGSIGESGWKAEGLGNWAANAGWRAASASRRIRNWRSPSARKLRTRIAAAQGSAETNRKTVRSRETEAKTYERRAMSLRESVRKQVLEEQTDEARSSWAVGESATWDLAAEIGSAKVGEAVLDYADVVWIPAREVRPFGGRISGVGAVEETDAYLMSDAPEGLAGRVFFGDDRSIVEEADAFGRFIKSPSERARFDELSSKGDNMTQQELLEWRNILFKDRILAARKMTSDGSWLATVNGDGTYTRLRNYEAAIQSTISTARPSDFSSIEGIKGIFVIPAGSTPMGVRSTVYGKTLDLRYDPDEYSELLQAMGTVRRKDLTGPKGGATKVARAVDQAYQVLFDAPPATSVEEQWRRIKDLRAILVYAKDDEAIAEAMRRRIWAAGLPDSVRQALVDRKVLVPDGVLRARIGNVLGGLTTETAKTEAIAEASIDQLRAEVAQLVDGLPEGEFVWQAGQRVMGDVLSPDIPMTPRNLSNFRGPGFYTTENGVVGGEYLVGRAGSEEFNLAGKAILDSIENKGKTDPALYVTDAPPNKAEFLDYDRPYQDSNLSDAFGDQLAVAQEDLQWQIDLLEDIKAEASDMYGATVDVTADGLDDAVFDFAMTKAFLDGMDAPEYPSMFDFIEYLVVSQVDAGLTQAEAWELTTNALRARGFKGARHMGGKNFMPDTPQHEVFIWWEPPELTLVDDISEQAIAHRDILMRLKGLQSRLDATQRAQKIADGVGGVRFLKEPLMAPNGNGDLVLNAVGSDNIAAVAADLGYGKVLVNDGNIPGKKAVVFLNDSLDVNGGLNNAIDNAIPNYLDEAFEESGSVVLNWASDAKIPDEILPGMERRLRYKAREVGPGGAARFDEQERLALIARMEETGATHVSIKTKGGNEWITKSQLAPSRRSAAEYIDGSRGDLIEAEVAQRLSRSDEFSDVMGKWVETRKELANARARLAQNETELKRLTAAYGDLRASRKAKRRSGRGTTTYKGQTWDDAFSENDQGNKYLSLASSEATTSRDTIGYTNDMTATLRRTASVSNYKPSQKIYWDTLTEYLNRMLRNDPIALRVMRNESDDEIIAWLRSSDQLARATVRDTARDGEIDSLIDAIANRRQLVEDYVPDASLREKLGKADVTADDVLIAQGWRDMPSLEALAYADTSNKFTRFTTRTMRILGTLPEDTVIRHPFYRARFNEEMRRQIDLFDGPTITDRDLKKFRKQSHSWALKSTRETLYTVTRLSTPAYALRFVLPFFPAWESSMKFWSKTAIQKPEVVVRYSQIIGAEGSGGLVLDEDMQPLDGEGRSLRDLPSQLFSPGGGWLVLPWPGGGQFDELMIPKESMNVILPGKYPWLPTADPIVQIPLSWMTKNNPTEASMIADWKAFGFPVGDIIAEQSLPFGRPYQESNVFAMLAEGALPPTVKRGWDILRGEDSQDFLATADAVFRDMLTRWELDGKVENRPTWDDAMSQARMFMAFRVGSGLLSPAAIRPVGEFEFFVAESRRLDKKYAGDPDAIQKSDDEFLALYGEVFFRYTKSISGSRGSGIAPTVGAQRAYEANPEEATALARIGDSGKMLQILTYPFGLEEDFNEIIYGSQLDATISGVQGRYLRGGPGTEQTILTGSASEDATQRSLGWTKYRQMEDALQAAATSLGLKNYQASAELLAWRRGEVQALQEQYPAWAADKASYDTDGYQDVIWGMQILMEGPNYTKNYGNLPLYGYMQEYLAWRQTIVDVLEERRLAGGSNRIDASSNADVAAVNEQARLYFTSTDVDPQWLAFYTRFLERDDMQPVMPLPAELRIGGR